MAYETQKNPFTHWIISLFQRTLKATNQEPDEEIKTTVRCHLTPARMAIIKKTKLTSAIKDMEKREPSCTVGGMQVGSATRVNSMEVSQKIKNRTTI